VFVLQAGLLRAAGEAKRAGERGSASGVGRPCIAARRARWQIKGVVIS
jgi:hypothetical protein